MSTVIKVTTILIYVYICLFIRPVLVVHRHVCLISRPSIIIVIIIIIISSSSSTEHTQLITRSRKTCTRMRKNVMHHHRRRRRRRLRLRRRRAFVRLLALHVRALIVAKRRLYTPTTDSFRLHRQHVALRCVLSSRCSLLCMSLSV